MSSSKSMATPNVKELATRYGVTEDEIKAYIKEFNTIDKNKDGNITAEELKAGLSSFGSTVSLDEAKTMIQYADCNKDGKIDLPEFLTLITRTQPTKPDIEKEALQAFTMLDLNKDGFISLSELRMGMAKLGQPLTDKEAGEMMKVYDKNKDGRIDYKEFLAAWKQMSTPKKK